MKVFISHQRKDAEWARRISSRLRDYGLESYLDVIDSALQKDGPELSDYLREQMTKCTQLLAVVSSSTNESWWVPWEVGVASEKDFLIATFIVESTQMPSYLKKWPYLRTMQDVGEYAKQSLSVSTRIRTAYSHQRASIAGNFHRELKRSLGSMVEVALTVKRHSLVRPYPTRRGGNSRGIGV